jgi:hypothetical protein
MMGFVLIAALVLLIGAGAAWVLSHAAADADDVLHQR